MNNDVLKLIEKLNKLNEEQIIKSFKASKNLDITKELFNYYCENNFALALKIYQNVDVRIKDAIKDVLFSHLNEFNKDVVMSLYLLGKDYQITYFKKHLIDVSLYDDFIYDVLINEEEHVLYLDYVEYCLEHYQIIVKNTKRLVMADLKSNNEAKRRIEKIILKLYQSKDYENMFDFANSTKSLSYLSSILHLTNKEIFAMVENLDISYYAKSLAFMLNYENELNGLYAWFKYLKNNINFAKFIELIITKCRIMTWDNDFVLHIPLDFKELISKQQLAKDEEYRLFYYELQTFRKFYRNPKEYLANFVINNKQNVFENKNEYLGKNVEVIPMYFNGELIEREYDDYLNFDLNEDIKNYLAKEADTLKSEVKIFINNCEMGTDALFRIYFNSILKYLISLDDFMELLNYKSEDYQIYNTKITGKLDYDKGNFYLKTSYGLIKIQILDFVDSFTICPGLQILCDLTSYEWKNKVFYVSDIVWQMNKSNKDIYKEILRDVRKKNILEEYHQYFNREDFLIYCSLKGFNEYEYLYYLYPDEFSNLKELIEKNIIYHIEQKNEYPMVKFFGKYIYGIDKKIILKEMIDYIRNILEKYKKDELEDLTNNNEFFYFRKHFNIIMNYLVDIDKEFYEKIIETLKQNKLLSITYFYLDKIDNEYYSKIRKQDNIVKFYESYPTFILVEDNLNVTNLDITDDLKFYILMKLLNRYPHMYEDVKPYLLKYFNKNTVYQEWLSKLFMNFFMFPKDSFLRAVIDENFDLTTLTIEEQEFVRDYRFIIKADDLSNKNDLKSILNSIQKDFNEDVIDKVKLLSQEELSKTDKLLLAEPILRIISKTNLKIDKIYDLLMSLGINNPFHMNNNYSKTELPEITKYESNLLVKKANALNNITKRCNFYGMSPLHLYEDFSDFFTKTTTSNMRVFLANYKLYGTIRLNYDDKNVKVFLTNVKSKYFDLSCSIDYFTNLPYKIIPNYDLLEFAFLDKKNYQTVAIYPIINFDFEEEALAKSLDNYAYFEKLTREEQEKIIIHYIRKDIIKAYKFDTSHIVSEEKYIQIANLLNRYHYTYEDLIYLYLLMARKDLFQELITSIKKYNILQRSLFLLQTRLLEENDLEIYDRLLEYLSSIHYLNKRFIIIDALPILKKRDSYQKYYQSFDSKDPIEKEFGEAYLNEYFRLKLLDLQLLKYTYKDEAYKIYLREIFKYSDLDEREIIYSTYIILKKIILEEEISDEDYIALEKLKSWELVKKNREVKALLADKFSINEYTKIFDKYALEGNPKDLPKIVLFSSFFPNLNFKLYNLIIDNEAYDLKKYIANDSYTNEEIKKDIHLSISYLNDTRSLSMYNIKWLRWAKKLYMLEYYFRKLRLTNEIEILLNTLAKRKMLIKELIFFKDFLKLSFSPLKWKEQLNIEIDNKYKPKLRLMIERNFDEYNIVSIITSKWFDNLLDISDKINDLNNYYQNYPLVSLYDLNVINFYQELYKFEKNLVNEKFKDVKIRIFMELLFDKKILYEEFILLDDLITAFNVIKQKFNPSFIKLSKNNILAIKMKNIAKSNVLFDKSMRDTKMYLSSNLEQSFIDFQKNLLNEKRYLDAALITLQYMINFPLAKLSKEMIDSLKKDEITIYDSKQEQFQFAYKMASLNLIKNHNLENFYLLVLNTEKHNPFYSTLISFDIEKLDYDFIIEDQSLSKEEKIYLYMRSILKYGVNFNEFILKLYENEIDNEMIELDLPYIFDLFVYNENMIKTPINVFFANNELKKYISCNVSVKIKGFIKSRDKVSFAYDILEVYQKSSLKLVSDDDVLKTIIHYDEDRPYEAVLKAICTSKKAFYDLLILISNCPFNSKFILFNKQKFDYICALFYASKILYEQKRHLLLKQFLYLLKENKILNSRFIYNKFNLYEYLYTETFSMANSISEGDITILYNIDFTKNLKEELLRMLKIVSDEQKLYLYYAICYNYEVFPYNVKFYYDEDVKKMLRTLINCLIDDEKNPEDFFESLGNNNIFKNIENGLEIYNELVIDCLIKHFMNSSDFSFYLRLLRNLKPLNDKNQITIRKEVYDSLNDEDRNLINNFYLVKIGWVKEEK